VETYHRVFAAAYPTQQSDQFCSNLLKASNADQQRGMDAMAVILFVLAIWLVISWVRPVWRKTSN